MKFQTLKKSAAALMAVILISKVVGMFRDIVLAKYYGTTAVSDAYLIAVSVPTLIFYFIGHSLSTAYLPMYNQIRQKSGADKALAYTNNLTCISFLIVTVLVAVLVAFTEPILKLFAPGFDEKTMALTVKMVRLSATSLYFMTLVSIWTGYLQANQNYIIPGAVSLARNAAIIPSIIVAARFGIAYLGIGLLAAYIAECLLLLPFAWCANYRPRILLRFREENVKETLYLVLPILLGMCVGQLNKMIDRSIASTMVTGGISALSYASMINTGVQEVLVTGVITILFASCAELVAQQQHQRVKQKLSATINMLAFLLLPATVGLIILAEEFVTNVLCRGSFTAASVQMTAGALRCYSCGLVFLAVRDTLVKLFYAYKDTRTTTVTSCLAIALNIGLNFLLSHWFGINGLAAATSLAAMAQCIALYILLRKKIGDYGTKDTVIVLLKSGAATCLMAALLMLFKGLHVFSALPSMVSFLILILIGAACYFVAALLLRIRPLMELLQRLRHRT